MYSQAKLLNFSWMKFQFPLHALQQIRLRNIPEKMIIEP